MVILEGFRGPSWARTSDPLIMSVIIWFPPGYIGLFLYSVSGIFAIKVSIDYYWLSDYLAQNLARFS